MEKTPALAILATLAATPAAAHLPPGEYGSFLAGVTHPLFGLDHVLAMIAVGLWAAQIGGRALWQVPTAFVLAMLAGFALALIGLPLPMVEPAILASIIVLGLVVAMALRPAAPWAMALVAGFALFHGHAHGGELGSAQALTFGTGFAIATAGLHAMGLLIALIFARALQAGSGLVLRIMGGATALAGAAIAFG
ncbi:HupE/UreJ family protein [Roseovarius sp. A21]|uniref:HupE/UreJ family protein n=1 Tax=Roseovarius bejariae TaxID=2576383 RepID=A0A844CV65_9RHOB|nr:HupE/UreJ family protein [Roseovarius bejariae]MRU15939.1 HupE/UreJ family protein [Roseovarius bejariae]